MTSAQRLKRVFDIEIWSACGGAVRIIACIEDAEVIEQLLTHLDKEAARWMMFAPHPCTQEMRVRGKASAHLPSLPIAAQSQYFFLQNRR